MSKTDFSLSNVFRENANPFGVFFDFLKDLFSGNAMQQGGFFGGILAFFGLNGDAPDMAAQRNEQRITTADIKVTGHPVGNLLSLIREHEAGGSYDAAYKDQDIIVNGRSIPPTEATVGQVLNAQKSWLAQGTNSTAVGGYQFINETLSGLVKEMNIPLDAKFDEALQDRLALKLLERRGLSSFQNGNISRSDFMENLSAEWAALPKDMSGDSYYEGHNGNRALVKPQEMVAALNGVKEGGGDNTVTVASRAHNASPSFS